MTKCDFCPRSKPDGRGSLICQSKSFWRCEEAIEKMMKYIKFSAETTPDRENK